MKIRKAEPADLSQVYAIEIVSHAVPWTWGDFVSELIRPDAEFWLMCGENNQVQGYIIFRLVLDECYVINITVAEANRRMGIGSLLMQHMMAKARKSGCERIVLDVRRDNHGALTFYESLGFESAGCANAGKDYIMIKKI
jgi:ribosomal-protein-alanine N-acetyltransferase